MVSVQFSRRPQHFLSFLPLPQWLGLLRRMCSLVAVQFFTVSLESITFRHLHNPNKGVGQISVQSVVHEFFRDVCGDFVHVQV
jgi:hypothetical protein